MHQAEALVAAIGGNVDAIYSSPTARCRQTVGPLAAFVGLPVDDLAELYEADDFREPAAGEAGSLPHHACTCGTASDRCNSGKSSRVSGRIVTRASPSMRHPLGRAERIGAAS
jgi:Histidine phosphatase superfamily (branch 1)